jgi:DNA-binding MarR family transcriptional regulator
MAKREFTDAFRTFVNKYITSVEQIEVLLILFANPDRAWTIHEISAILRSSPHSITSRLHALEHAGLARAESDGYRYASRGKSHEMVEMLQEEYGARRFSVIELVFSRPDAARSFADAFRFKDENDERSR